MSASYPGSVPSFTTKQDQVDINFAAHINRLQDEVRAIAAELGVDPSGPFSTVRARLSDFTENKADRVHNHDGRYWRRNLVTTKGQILGATGPENLAAITPSANNRVLLSDSSAEAGARFAQVTHELFGDLGGDHYEQYALADGTRGAFLPLAGGTMLGPVVLDGHREKVTALTQGGAGAMVVDAADANVFTLTLDDALEITAADTSGLGGAVSVSLLLTGGTGGHVVTWSNVTWLGSGDPPPLGSGEVALVSLFSVDGGSTWLGVSLIEF